MVRKKKLIEVDEALWNLLGAVAKAKDKKLADILEQILEEKLAPFRELLSNV